MKLMHVDSSPKGEWSNSRALSKYFVDVLKALDPDLSVDYLDLTVDTPPHVTREFSIATYTLPPGRTPEMTEALVASDKLCRRLLDADLLVFAMPMYNWGMPSTFKAFVDQVVRAGLTYKVSPEGQYVGQLHRQKVLFLTTRGADLGPGSPFAAMDALTPSLRNAFGFIGVASPTFVDAQPVQFADLPAREAALDRAKTELGVVAQEWASTWSAAPTGQGLDQLATA